MWFFKDNEKDTLRTINVDLERLKILDFPDFKKNSWKSLNVDFLEFFHEDT